MNDNKIKKIDNSNEFHFNNNIQVGKLQLVLIKITIQ